MAYLFQSNAVFFVCVVFFLGLLVGSFLNVVIYRLPIMLDIESQQDCSICEKLRVIISSKQSKCEDCSICNVIQENEELSQKKFNLFVPRSACPKCNEPVRMWQNIPVFSFLLLKGKCFYCKNPISIRYPLVELLTGIMFAVIAWYFGYGLQTLFGILFTALLISITFIDADTKWLPDILSLSLLWLGLLASILGKGVFVSPDQAILGAIVGYLSLWSISTLFLLITGRVGMGGGDMKLLAAFGAWLGVAPLLVVVLLSSVTGLLYAVIIRLGLGRQMPFGPYLACAGWLTLLYGKDILQWMYPGMAF